MSLVESIIFNVFHQFFIPKNILIKVKAFDQAYNRDFILQKYIEKKNKLLKILN